MTAKFWFCSNRFEISNLAMAKVKKSQYHSYPICIQ
jgi:hypothetical protein